MTSDLVSKLLAGGLSAGVFLLWWPSSFPVEGLEWLVLRGVLRTLCFEVLLLAFVPLATAGLALPGALLLDAPGQAAQAAQEPREVVREVVVERRVVVRRVAAAPGSGDARSGGAEEAPAREQQGAPEAPAASSRRMGPRACGYPPSAMTTTEQQVVGPRDPALAPMKAQVYRDERPASYFTRFHERARTREPDAAYEVVRVLTTLYGLAIFRLRAISSEKVPQSGPVILAPNHFSFMDHFFLGAALRRKVRFMAKSQLFKPPAQFVYTHGGVFPVRRGFRDEEAFLTARTILGRGGCMAMYCEGGRSRTGVLSEKPKPGIGRVALLSGAPIVPVAIHGSSKVRNWKRGQFPQITVQYGDPIRYTSVPEPTRHQQQSVAEDVFAEIKSLYQGLERLGRKGVLARVRAQRRAERAARKTAATV